MIVDLAPHQAEDILKIWLEASLLAHDFVPKEVWEGTLPMIRREILPRAKTRVFLREDRPVGFLSLLEGDYIGALFVSPSCQGQGIGSALLADCKLSHPLLTLSVYQENHRSVEFYRHQGFFFLEERVDEATGHPEYWMAWKKE